MAAARRSRKRTAASYDVVPTPLELMVGRSWRGAFLTTYSLSVSFLEAQVLPILEEKDHCELDVLVDVKGYRDSLFERHSARVGQDYRLVPVSTARGCFHPKTALLWGEDGGLLVVGSGNLTFGGHGRNLEVFEAFEPRKDAKIFAGYAEFLAALRERLGADIPDAGPITRALMEAERMADGALPGLAFDMEPQLLHSVRTPIIDQVVEIAGDMGMGACSRITVMSPFYDAGAETVRRLARRLGCGEILVAVPLAADENRFPFRVARAWTESVKAVKLHGEDRRPIHAKVLEMSFADGTLTLTGSVNATRPALGTADNIEVGILRYFEHSPFAWTRASVPPGVAIEEGEAEEDVPERIVHAVVTRDGRLVGQFLGGIAGCAGTWQSSVQAGGVQVSSFFVQVGPDGAFASDDFDVGSILGAGAIQIVLERTGLRARGWLQVEGLLSGARFGRMSSTEILRLTLGRGTAADITALLEYLARHFAREGTTHRAFGSRVEWEGPENVMIGYEDLLPREEDPGHEGGGHGEEARLTLERIRRFLLRRPTVALAAEDEGVFEEEAEGSGARLPMIPPEPEEAFSVSDFEEIMREALSEPERHPAVTAEALTMWFEGMMAAHLHAPVDRTAEARAFLHFWTMKTLRDSRREVTPALDSLAVTAAVLCFDAGRLTLRHPSAVAALRTAFENWWGGPVDRERARMLLAPRRLACVTELVGLAERGHGEEWNVQGVLDDFLGVVTPARQVSEALARWRAGLPPDDSPFIFATKPGAEFRVRLSSLPQSVPAAPEIFPKNVSAWTPGLGRCPSCHYSISAALLDLELRGVAACQWCTRILVRAEG